jgi:hypothetical protein
MSDKAAIKLAVVSGPMQGREFRFEEHDVFVLGRAPDCHCVLPDDPCVSRHHFLLEANPPDCCIQDLGSLNGTHINDVKHGGRNPDELPQKAARRNQTVAIRDGDTIRIGDTTLKVRIEAPAICARCGKALEKAEAESIPKGDVVCRACRAKPKNRQEELLAKIIGDAMKNQQECPQIPGYEIERKLGEGGMGRVFLARVLDKKNPSPFRNRETPLPKGSARGVSLFRKGKIVALKTMLPRKSAVSEADVRRFQREMAVCAQLQHPNIVAYIDQGYHNGIFYFVMEYCPAGSVQDRLASSGGKLTVAESVAIISQALNGLAYAHRQGIVHRDLKPSNVLLAGSAGKETAMIADFGLAKNFQQAGLSGMTMSGVYSGTMPFMPPEQVIAFRDVKPVSDVFSVGAMLYLMLTGQYAYDLAGADEPIRAILEKKIVPIRERKVKLPARLADVVDCAIAPETRDRFPTALAMKKALKEAT